MPVLAVLAGTLVLIIVTISRRIPDLRTVRRCQVEINKLRQELGPEACRVIERSTDSIPSTESTHNSTDLDLLDPYGSGPKIVPITLGLVELFCIGLIKRPLKTIGVVIALLLAYGIASKVLDATKPLVPMAEKFLYENKLILVKIGLIVVLPAIVVVVALTEFCDWVTDRKRKDAAKLALLKGFASLPPRYRQTVFTLLDRGDVINAWRFLAKTNEEYEDFIKLFHPGQLLKAR